jgi:hypothetical protein
MAPTEGKHKRNSCSALGETGITPRAQCHGRVEGIDQLANITPEQAEVVRHLAAAQTALLAACHSRIIRASAL